MNPNDLWNQEQINELEQMPTFEHLTLIEDEAEQLHQIDIVERYQEEQLQQIEAAKSWEQQQLNEIEEIPPSAQHQLMQDQTEQMQQIDMIEQWQDEHLQYRNALSQWEQEQIHEMEISLTQSKKNMM